MADAEQGIYVIKTYDADFNKFDSPQLIDFGVDGTVAGDLKGFKAIFFAKMQAMMINAGMVMAAAMYMVSYLL